SLVPSPAPADDGSRPDVSRDDTDRSPVDLALSPDGTWLVTANETAHSLSLIRTEDGRVVDEIPCGRHPADVIFTPDGQTVLVTGSWSGDVTLLRINGEELERVRSIPVGGEPW